MPFTGFPEQIEVTLGSGWDGSGAGFAAGQTKVFTKYSESSLNTYYSLTGSATPSSENRIRFNFDDNAYLFTGSPTLYKAGTRFHFVDAWQGTSIAFGNLGVFYKNLFTPITGTVLPPWNFTDYFPNNWTADVVWSTILPSFTLSGSGSGDVTPMFSTMEAYEPGRGPDKTTYRYG